jgi:NAD(P) transhydrogenase subunit beta
MTVPLGLSQTAINFTYLVAGVCFIVGIKRLSTPATARSGNLIAAAGMAIAIAFTFLDPDITSYWLIIVAMAIGAVVGVASARLVKMTAMPQMVALFNGVGGGAAALIAAAEYHRLAPDPGHLSGDSIGAMLFSALIGSISFSGSLIAFGKLQEVLPGRPLTFAGQHIVNGALLAVLVGFGIAAGVTEEGIWMVLLLAGALLFGVLLVLPIGGADMPVVISLLNAFTGLAAASAGFVLNNTALIIGGTLVGASGTLLTILMGRAMNRSIANVLFGAFGQLAPATAAAAGATDGQVRSASAEDVAVMLAYAHKVVFVPGYGMAVAQAQHDVHALAALLESRGVEVSYAIHPVAGRMPGHMNVLLAEANVPYPQLKEMDEANNEFPRTDVVLVIGANDVVNPDARSNQGSPIYGMPILNVDQSQQVVVLKRSMNPGFAGIENPLFLNPKTVMLFGDAKESVEKLAASVKAV